MKANQTYFYRNRGSWNWRVYFKLVSWSALWQAEISFFSKSCLSALAAVQKFFGPLEMWTHVDFRETVNIVHHSTKLKKYGLTLYKSEKRFVLNENGSDLRLEGKEFYWPISFVGFSFEPAVGAVDSSTSRAFYQMPMAGAKCDCHAFLELPEGYIEISAPWINGKFSLTEASNKKLQERFEET